MIEWIKNLVRSDTISVQIPEDFCEGRTNKELFDYLEKEIYLSKSSGNKILIELLKRALKEN